MSHWRPPFAAAFHRIAPAAIFILAPRTVHACAVCFGGQEGDTRTAFIVTTAFLTFLPLLIIGGVVWWLRRRFRQLELDEQAATAYGHARRPQDRLT